MLSVLGDTLGINIMYWTIRYVHYIVQYTNTYGHLWDMYQNDKKCDTCIIKY